MDYLFIDVESGGTSPSRHAILQFGAVAMKDSKIIGAIQFYVKPTREVQAEALAYNSLDMSIVESTGLDPVIASDRIVDFLWEMFQGSKPILVGHNVGMDKYMTSIQLFEECGRDLDKYVSYRCIDTMSLLWGLHLAGKLPIEACSSSGAFKHFGIEVKNRHTALGDIYATIDLFTLCLEMMKQ